MNQVKYSIWFSIHNSLSWGTDQIANTWYDSNNITFSFNIFSESLHDNGSNDEGPAGRGLLIGSEGAHSISIHHNLIAHSYQRNPMLVTSGVVDVVNNLVYHWVSRAGQQKSEYEGQKVNWVKNRFIARTDGWFSKKKQLSKVAWGDINLSETRYSLKESVYFEDNIGHYRKYGFEPQWKIAFTDRNVRYKKELGYHTDKRFPAPPISEVPVNKLQAYLLPKVGAILPKRDSVDSRITREVQDSTGKMPNCVSENDREGDSRCENNVGGWPIMEKGSRRQDSDADGIPDDWEEKNGLNPQKFDSLGDQNADGYLNIENWVHSL